MARDVAPPKDPAALAAILGGEAPKTEAKPAKEKTPKAQAQPEAVLPAGKMGDPCRHKPCKGKLRDFSIAHIGKTSKTKAKTLITLVCTECNKVQAQSEIIDPS